VHEFHLYIYIYMKYSAVQKYLNADLIFSHIHLHVLVIPALDILLIDIS
jgi:hypothetical protein